MIDSFHLLKLFGYSGGSLCASVWLLFCVYTTVRLEYELMNLWTVNFSGVKLQLVPLQPPQTDPHSSFSPCRHH